MIKSKKYKGVYHRKKKDGDVTYYFTYKEDSKTKYQKVGTKSQGVNESYVNELRLRTISTIKTGELPPKLVRNNSRYKTTVNDISEFYFTHHRTKSSEKRQRQYNFFLWSYEHL